MSYYSRRRSSRYSRSSSRYDSGYSYYGFAPYVPVAERRAKALAAAKKATKGGTPFSPVNIEGRLIAKTFWGKAWCEHLESYSDYENRLPRGRTYVRNGSVIDLQIAPGKITAKVSGSELYTETIEIKPLAPERWEAIKQKCAGRIDSLVDLLKGKLSDAVMQIITDREHGLFPAPAEIKKKCSCPDVADLCKHLAAVLYGVGARLDTHPQLLFTLRGVDHNDLLAAAAAGVAQIGADTVEGSTLTGENLADVFGIEIDTTSPAPASASPPPPPPEPAATPVAVNKKQPAKKSSTDAGKTQKKAPARRLSKTKAAKKTPVKKGAPSRTRAKPGKSPGDKPAAPRRITKA